MNTLVVASISKSSSGLAQSTCIIWSHCWFASTGNNQANLLKMGDLGAFLTTSRFFSFRPLWVDARYCDWIADTRRFTTPADFPGPRNHIPGPGTAEHDPWPTDARKMSRAREPGALRGSCPHEKYPNQLHPVDDLTLAFLQIKTLAEGVKRLLTTTAETLSRRPFGQFLLAFQSRQKPMAYFSCRSLRLLSAVLARLANSLHMSKFHALEPITKQCESAPVFLSFYYLKFFLYLKNLLLGFPIWYELSSDYGTRSTGAWQKRRCTLAWVKSFLKACSRNKESSFVANPCSLNLDGWVIELTGFF